MDSKLVSRRDLAFVLYELLDVETLTRRPRYAEHSRETFDAALDVAERIARDHFAPHNRAGDENEPTFDGERVSIIPQVGAALEAFVAAGLMAAEHDAEYGGMQLPLAVAKACFAFFNAANVGTASYPFLTIGSANLLLAHGSAAQIDTYVRPMLAGRWFGTMCLSEPQAGSSLSDIRTLAVPQDDGTYRLTGNKMWISAGDHELSENIVHLVLARTPGAPAGVKGISLFVVPKYLARADGGIGERNDVVLAGLNHKMGYRGTVNTLLNFGEGRFRPGGRAGAVGGLVGELHRGLACMFHMMNEARIGVGLGATMLGYTAYLHALDYARGRPQGRHPRAKDPASPQVPIIEHADVRRMLLAQKAYAEGALALNLYCARLVDDERGAESAAAREEAGLLLELLTPVAKSWPSQWCQEGNSLAIQVHGGYGYTRDYPVEQFYRDQRLNPIHEGTHGIQAIDLLGRKVAQKDGAALRLLGREIEKACREAGALRETVHWARALGEATARIGLTTQKLHAAGDPDRMLANAAAYLEAFGHVVVAWVWLRAATVAARRLADGAGAPGEEAFYRGKLAAAAFFFRWELPKTAAWCDLLDALDTTTLDMRDDWF
ncbi:MAG: acyl-CoA dehydrogenase [Burkholderiales bacterium]|nr:acyl-CoA dehydrogenase [Burkholderiales bacterium]